MLDESVIDAQLKRAIVVDLYRIYLRLAVVGVLDLHCIPALLETGPRVVVDVGRAVEVCMLCICLCAVWRTSCPDELVCRSSTRDTRDGYLAVIAARGLDIGDAVLDADPLWLGYRDGDALLTSVGIPYCDEIRACRPLLCQPWRRRLVVIVAELQRRAIALCYLLLVVLRVGPSLVVVPVHVPAVEVATRKRRAAIDVK